MIDIIISCNIVFIVVFNFINVIKFIVASSYTIFLFNVISIAIIITIVPTIVTSMLIIVLNIIFLTKFAC